ncbi:MAG: tetratricopeptide repeat protein [Acidobacteria bacterium]|nr:tetratricopeptide repeat protein [Acidobacteriota bacterium]
MDPSRVPAFLDEACGGDAEMREKIERMLAQDDASDSTNFLTPQSDDPTATAIAPRAITPGSTVGKRFKITRFVGRGGMGDVYEAEDLELGGRVALKTVRPALLSEPQVIARFRRETQLARQVTHPNICRVFDVGHDDLGGQKLTFLTMEFLDGDTLGRQISRQGKMTEQIAAELAKQMAAGLDALHMAGIVHRDLKPGNIMLVSATASSTRAVINDFGLARAFEGVAPNEEMTQSGMILGTPAYMAPEQLLGEPASKASDIYAFGLILAEMVTGKRVFNAEGAIEHAMARAKMPELPATLSNEWRDTLTACLARDPEDRPASASAVAEGLAGTMTLRVPSKTPSKTIGAPSASKKKWLGYGAVALGVALIAAPFVIKVFRDGSDGAAPDELVRARQLLQHNYRPANVAEAKKILEEFVAREPGSALARSELANAYWSMYTATRDPAYLTKAQEEAAKASSLDRELEMPHILLGILHKEAGRNDMASAELRRALQLNPRSSLAHSSMAGYLANVGRNDEAEKGYRTAIDLSPENWRAHFQLANHLASIRKTAEAREKYQETVRLSPENPEPHNNLGSLLVGEGRFAEARQAYERSIAIEPRYRTYVNLGGVLLRMGDLEAAAAAYKKAVDMNPNTDSSWAGLASFYYYAPGQREKSREPYLKAIELAETSRQKSPNDTTLLSNLISYYAAVGKFDKAVPLFRQATALESNNPRIALRGAELYALMNNKEEAIRLLAKAIQLGYSVETARRNPDVAPLLSDPRFLKVEPKR